MADLPRADDPTQSLDATKPLRAPRAPPAARYAEGAHIGRYLVLGALGQGGMGAVYAAYDPRLDRKVALKLLLAEDEAFLPGSVATARLEREAQALARLSHPNIVAVHDVGTHNGEVFIAMELIEGQTLKGWLEEKPRAPREVLRAMSQAGLGLAAIHGAGLVHRDFKAANVVVSADGRVKVLDFGLARLADDSAERVAAKQLPTTSAPSSSALDTPLTVEGYVPGTPGYVAPELFAGKPPSAAADQFAFGVTLYQALYGRRPWGSQSFEHYRDELKAGPPSAPPSGSKAPRWLFPIVGRAIATRPTDRYPSMRALVEALGKDPAKVFRQRVGLAALLLVAGLSVWGGQRLLRGDCATRTSLLNRLWPLAAKGELRAAFASKRPEASAQIDRALALLDQRVNAWATASETACRVASRRGATPLELARQVCLRRRGDAVETLVAVLREGDAMVASKLEELVDFFTADLDCADARALNRLTPDDVPPAKLAVAHTLRANLLRARAMQSLEKGTDALTLARSTAAEARANGLPGFEGEAMYRVAYLEAFLGEDEQALRDYRRALFAALEAGVDDRALWSAVKLTRKLALREGASGQAQDMLELSETLLHRLGDDASFEIDVIDAREAVLRARGELEAMTQLNRRRLELARTGYGENSDQTAQAMADLANALWREGRMPEAVELEEKAVALLVRIEGPDYNMLPTRYLSLAISLSDAGRSREAREMLEKGFTLSLRILDANDTTLADYQDTLAWQLAGVDEARALDLATRAVGRYERSKDSADLADALLARARPLAALGRGADALADCDRAAKLYAPRADAEKSHERSIEMCRGRAQLALGHADDAVAAFSAAHALEPRSRSPEARGRLALALAQALAASGAEPDRVHAMSEEAKTEFRAFPALAERVAEVDATLARTPRPAKRGPRR